MVTVSLQFTAGRFHATPWGRHVNEGSVEWPPSHWRFLRALVSVWHLKSSESVTREQLRRIIHKLSEPPAFSLPPASSTAVRHYMPGGGHKEGVKRDVDLVLDSSVVVHKEHKLYLHWHHVNLSDVETASLKELLSKLSYFGRSESWVSACLEEEVPVMLDSKPLHESSDSDEIEVVDMACAIPAGEYAIWRGNYLTEALQNALAAKKQKSFERGRSLEGVALTKKERQQIETELPEDLLEAMELTTAEIRNGGWSISPGMRLVTYSRPVTAFSIKHIEPPPPHTSVKAVRYALSSRVLPAMTDVVSVGDRMRTYLMGISGKKYEGRVPEVFSGKGSDGSPLQSNHSHAYYLSETCQGRGRISHVTVYSRAGFNREELDVLLSLKGIWGRGGYDVKLIPLESGDPEALGGTDAASGQCPVMAESIVWESLTPFYSARHISRSRIRKSDAVSNHLLNEVRRQLAYAGHPQPEQVEILPVNGIVYHDHLTTFNRFFTKRKGGIGPKPSVPAAAIRLVFDRPVRGPIAIGFGSHFGLGLFCPEVL